MMTNGHNGRIRYRAVAVGPAWWPWRWQIMAESPIHGAPSMPVGRRRRRDDAVHEAAWQNACETARLNRVSVRHSHVWSQVQASARQGPGH